MAPDTLTAQDPQPSAKTPAERRGGTRDADRGAARPWALAVALAIPLSVIYLIVQPPSGDLAAATYRGEVFARAGFTLWDNGWYSGHYLPGYSLLAPALGALAGERLLLALCTVAAAGLFGVLAERSFEAPGARVAALSFALGACVTMLSGRVAFGLGLTIGLLALVALQRGRPGAALALAALTSFASPVAGAFLALAGLAYTLAAAAPGPLHARRRGLALMAAALAPILLLTLAFPEGGWEPFAPSVFWPALAGVVAIAALLPRVRSGLTPPAARTLAWGAWLYACALIGSYALHTPVGSNAARLGELFAAPLVAGALWKRRPPTTNEPATANERPGSPASGRLRRLLAHPLALLALAPVLLYWQLETPINDVSSLAGDPSVNASYYAPLLGELQRRAHGAPLRVEVALTGAHWESAYLPERGSIVLARGWERQLDTRYAALFYTPTLGAAAYRTWLYENAVSYVAVPDVRLDFAGTAEGRLIAHGVPYLNEVWHSPHWRLFAVVGAPPLAQPPAFLTALGTDSFTLIAPRPGAYEVRVRFTPYWALETGRGCVRHVPGGWTAVQARRAGTIRVGIDFALTRIFSQGPRCS
jgi:hypothetical protein